MRTLFAALLLLASSLGAAAADRARIEQDYARKMAAQQQQDIDQRIAVRAQALNQAPGSPVLGNPAGRCHDRGVFRLRLPLLQGGRAQAGSAAQVRPQSEAGAEGVSHP
jgi:hypothetical protein